MHHLFVKCLCEISCADVFRNGAGGWELGLGAGDVVVKCFSDCEHDLLRRKASCGTSAGSLQMLSTVHDWSPGGNFSAQDLRPEKCIWPCMRYEQMLPRPVCQVFGNVTAERAANVSRRKKDVRLVTCTMCMYLVLASCMIA